MSAHSQPIYGNYRSYYQTRRFSAHDERLMLLPKDFFSGKTVLDIGCNEGWVSCEIAQRCSASRVLGVDIDSALVAAAWKRRKYLWSLSEPLDEATSASSSRKRKRESHDCHKQADSEETNPRYALPHFPISMPHLYGSLPLPTPADISEPVITAMKFPYNVGFRTCDWLTESRLEVFDIVIAFSITKWIHLNHGDDGLRAFFQRAYDSLRPNSGAKLVLEPQKWEGYAKAKRMDERLRQNAQNLKIRPEHFPELLVNIGFKAPVNFGTAGQGGLCRPVDVYERP